MSKMPEWDLNDDVKIGDNYYAINDDTACIAHCLLVIAEILVDIKNIVEKNGN